MDSRSFDNLRLDVHDEEGLRDVLTLLVKGARRLLGDNFLAAWLQGSLATGDFEDLSDVDFIIAVHEDPDADRAWAERERATEESHRPADGEFIAHAGDFLRYVMGFVGHGPCGHTPYPPSDSA